MVRAAVAAILLPASIIAVLASTPVRAVQPSLQSDDTAKSALAILNSHCAKCHGNDATGGFSLKDLAAAVAKSIIKPGSPRESRIYIRVALSPGDPMPPKSENKALTPAEQETIRAWIEAGAKSPVAPPPAAARQFFADADALAEMRADILTIPERERAYVRYFTLYQLYNAGFSEAEVQSYRVALSKLLNALSWQKRIAIPQPVDTQATIFRIDMRKYAWSADTWSRILDAYPYRVSSRSDTARDLAAMTSCLLPNIRADWFIARAAVPPLYHDILEMPGNVADLEKKLLVDVDKDFREETVVRAGFSDSGVSRNNRIVERHESAYGAYWRSYDFSASTGKQNIFKNPLDFEAAGGEIIYVLPNGLQAYMLVNGKGERIDAGLTDIVSNRENANDPVVRNGLTCMSCHTAGLRRFTDQIRAVVEQSRGTEFDRAKALAVYTPASTLAGLVAEDQRRYAEAVRATGAEISETEPLVKLSARYESSISARTAAAELGVDDERFHELLRSSRFPSSLAVLRTESSSVKRDAWEEGFAEAALLAPDTFIVPSTFRPAHETAQGQTPTHQPPANATAPTRATAAPGKPHAVVERDRYSGRLLPSDLSFVLHLMSNGTASAEWQSSQRKVSHLDGTYTGADGNFTVYLSQTSGENLLGVVKLNLVPSVVDGLTHASFTTDRSTLARPVVELRLEEASTDGSARAPKPKTSKSRGRGGFGGFGGGG